MVQALGGGGSVGGHVPPRAAEAIGAAAGIPLAARASGELAREPVGA